MYVDQVFYSEMNQYFSFNAHCLVFVCLIMEFVALR